MDDSVGFEKPAARPTMEALIRQAEGNKEEIQNLVRWINTDLKNWFERVHSRLNEVEQRLSRLERTNSHRKKAKFDSLESGSDSEGADVSA